MWYTMIGRLNLPCKYDYDDIAWLKKLMRTAQMHHSVTDNK